MKAVYLFIVNCMIFLAMSQIEYDGWNTVPSPTAPADCEQIGAYDSSTEEVRIYGGRNNPDAAYIFDPKFQNYSSVDTAAALTPDITVEFSSKQSDETIYYVSGTDLRGLNITDDSDTVYATLPVTHPNYGVCINENNGEVYLVGSKIIHTCIPDSSSPIDCTNTAQTNLSCIACGAAEGQELRYQACEVYNDLVYVFGGRTQGPSAAGTSVNTIWRCDPSVADSCTDISDTLITERGGITTARITCFGGKYVALIGGYATDIATLVSRVEVFNLENETIDSNYVSLPGRAALVATFDPISEQIFVFGGLVTLASCSNIIFVTDAPMGVCTTMEPTMDPTMIPTVDPTIDPTMDPTIDPTMDPTVNPSMNPTAQPTTPMPTTMAPTTADPTTANPTAAGGNVIITPTRPIYQPTDDDYDTPPTAYAVIITILVIICCIIFCCYCYYDKEEKEHVYGRMEQREAAASGASAGGTAVAMAGVVAYCGECGKTKTECSC